MNISVLRGVVQRRLCRQAVLWATARRRHIPPRQYTMLIREAHNSLYQMVKKRTLEARTKLQANRFPNNEACAGTPDYQRSQAKLQTAPSPSKPTVAKGGGNFLATSSTIGTQKSEHITSPKTKKSTAPASSSFTQNPRPSSDTEKPKVACQNTELLRARDCHGGPSKKSTQDPSCDEVKPLRDHCPPSNSSGSGGYKPPDECEDEKNRMLLYGLLAALGAGGLLWWWLRRNKNYDDNEDDLEEACAVVKKSIPATSAELPTHVPYLLIGGGTAAFSAFRAIKSNDAKAKVLMITDELQKPYMRPPLSKELWYSAAKGDLTKDLRFKQWTGAERSLYFEPEEFFVDPRHLMGKVNGGIAVAQGFKVDSINPERRIVTLSDGYEISYEECLIATGCSPKSLPVFDNAPTGVKDKVMVYRTPIDFERLKLYADENKTITIIGNGFIGSELACALANYTKKKSRIYQVFPEEANMSRVLPKYLSKWTTKKIESNGVCVINKAAIKEATRDNDKLKLTLSNGKTLLTDIAVVCVGCEANTQLAASSGLEVSKRLGGFVVNSELEARRNLYVAGDASCFYDPLLGRRRVEHHDHSVVSGRLAGENMTGKNKPYAHQSMFWSDLGPDIGYEGIGLVDATLPTVGIFALGSDDTKRTDNLSETKSSETKSLKKCLEDLPDADIDCNGNDNYGRGVIFYIKDDKIVGVLLWNLFNRIGLARTIINQNKKYDDLNEVAKLFEIHS